MENYIIEIALIIFGVVPFLFAAFLRRERHKEMIAMIEKGIVDPLRDGVDHGEIEGGLKQETRAPG